MAWLCYIVAFFLFFIYPSVGLVVLLIGMLLHWKGWLAGIAAFIVGLNWKKPI